MMKDCNMKNVLSIDPRTPEQAIEACMPIIYKVAHKFKRNHHQDFNDLVQIGCMGALHAFSKYEKAGYKKPGSKTPTNKFTTYAYSWIWAEIKVAACANWERMNNTAALDVEEYELSSTCELNTDVLDRERRFAKLLPVEQKMWVMRVEGYTWDEISQETGFGTLSQCRNHFNKVVSE